MIRAKVFVQVLVEVVAARLLSPPSEGPLAASAVKGNLDHFAAILGEIERFEKLVGPLQRIPLSRLCHLAEGYALGRGYSPE